MSSFDAGTDTRIAKAWREHHAHLLNVAFGVLGDIGAAEDAVQEAFVRLSKADLDTIDDLRGWLTVVTSRIGLDQLGSARSRHERPHETDSIEYAGRPFAQAQPVDPADRVTLDDEVSLALLVLLQRLKPAERVVFLLHDVFQLPFDTIAETVGRSTSTCRQLARRARAKIAADDRIGVDVDPTQHREVAERFIEAASDGDLEALVTLLDPSVWGDVDLGPRDKRTGTRAHGARQVAADLLRYMRNTTMVSHPIAGDTVVLAFARQRLYAVIVLTIEDGVITTLHTIADRQKLSLVYSALPPGPST